MHIPKHHGAVLGKLLRFAGGYRRRIQNGVDPLHGIGNDQLVLAHIHDLRQGQGDHRGDDDVKQQIQQQIRRHTILCQQQAACNEAGKHPVDGSGIEQHGDAQFLCIGNHPLFVCVNGSLKPFEGEHRLPKGFDHGNAPNILHRLVGHGCQGIAVLPHFFRHLLAGHGRHNGKRKEDRQQTQQSQPPVEYEQQHQKPCRGCHSTPLVRQLMGKIGFRCPGALLNDLAQLAAAEGLRKAQGELCQMGCHRQAKVGRHPECRQVGAHQRPDVNSPNVQKGNQRRQSAEG